MNIMEQNISSFTKTLMFLINILELLSLVNIQHLKIKPQSILFQLVRKIEANHIYFIYKYVCLHREIVFVIFKGL